MLKLTPFIFLFTVTYGTHIILGTFETAEGPLKGMNGLISNSYFSFSESLNVISTASSIVKCGIVLCRDWSRIPHTIPLALLKRPHNGFQFYFRQTIWPGK